MQRFKHSPYWSKSALGIESCYVGQFVSIVFFFSYIYNELKISSAIKVLNR